MRKSMTEMFKRAFFLFILASGVSALAACGGGGGSAAGGGAEASGHKGELAVSLTDANECDFEAVNVTVEKVRVHQSESAPEHDRGWIEIVPPNGPVKVNLLNLQNGDMADLGLASLPVAHYTQVRLHLVPNTGDAAPFNNSVVVGTEEFPLNIPPGFNNGIKLKPEFDIVAGKREELILDVDACRSILKAKNGSYYLRPRLLSVRKAEAGSIVGAVDPRGVNTVVKAEVNGFVYKQTRVKADGTFTLYPLPNSDLIKTLFPKDPTGAFDVVIVSESAATVVTTGVPVKAGGQTVLSTTTQPISLSPSSPGLVTGTINPTSADLRIRQTINSQPYQIRRHSPDLADGSYDFLLSTAAPMFGAYTGTQPIAYQTDLTAAAKYTLDTPNDDDLYKVHEEEVTAPASILPIKLTPSSGTAGSVTGNLNIVGMPAPSETILIGARTEDEAENVNTIGVDVSTAGVFSYSLENLAPGTYIITILHAKGFTSITPSSYKVTIPNEGATLINKNFTLSP